ncbi:hypothetical protein [Chitinophaga tropicalis]|uniref:Outer membrane protein beta-barrel domain-containing protein n=1 Tax=Chitinophaga tropicalis TaxID=2683588 RepID=A0A7K1U907_9BACT|nr:hypothetical protein [Chitinophaga tropicalis]MVT10778.1 hypothetical protein [Chitinophaga tropicalis]
MKKLLITIVCSMCTVVICAQLAWLSTGKQPLPGAYSRNFHQLFSILQQQAGLAYIPAVTAGVASEQRFMLKALSTHTAALAIPAMNGGFGLTLQQAGYREYRQQSVGAGYGRKLGNRFSLGMQIDYLSVKIPGYTTAGTITFESGCLLHITSQLHAGIHLFNPVGRKLENEVLPVIYTAGLGYEVSPEFLLSIVLKQHSNVPPSTAVMCEYRPVKQLLLRSGISSDPQFTNMAAGVLLRRLYLSVTGSHHPQLGITPEITITWQVKE